VRSRYIRKQGGEVRNNFMILRLQRKSLRKLTQIDETQADGGWCARIFQQLLQLVVILTPARRTKGGRNPQTLPYDAPTDATVTLHGLRLSLTRTHTSSPLAVKSKHIHRIPLLFSVKFDKIAKCSKDKSLLSTGRLWNICVLCLVFTRN
jgi:hypothetical protein